MSREVIAPRGTVPVRGRIRGLALWAGVTLTAGALPALLSAELGAAGSALADAPAGTPFDTLLAAAAAVVLCGCAAWAWLCTTAALALALAGSTRQLPGCPDGVRRLVLAACGVAAVVAAAPAQAQPADPGAGSPPSVDPSSVDPPRADPSGAHASAAALPRPEPVTRQTVRVVRVRPGDSLWALAQASLPAAATDADVDRAWRALWAANRDVVGPDPDLIRPGTLLRRPTPKEHR